MRLADQTDLGRSLFKQTNSAWFTHTMSPGATTEGNDLNKKGSSHDIKATCSLVLNEFWKKNCENFEKLLKWLPEILAATLSCYDGDCSKYPANSYVCVGGHSNS